MKYECFMMDNSTLTIEYSKFGVVEYITFGSLLGISALIGIYYGCIKGNQGTVTEYMLGGKTMSVFPIGLSLCASHVSGITLLGLPAEMYEYGTQYVMHAFATIIVVYITNKYYLPVFFSLQLYSVYEYLELRFSKTVRKLCSLIFASALMLYIPMVIYTPALAFHQVSGADIHLITPLICGLCIFYTTIGGLKAVVWTDTIQGLFTIGATIVVSILGVISVGGLQEVYNANARGNRLEFFNMDINPLSRTTFCSALIGSIFSWVCAITVHPGSTQRFVALPSMKAAQLSMIWFGIGVNVLVLVSSFVGTIMFANYEKCDPLKADYVQKSGQLLPYYVQEVASSFPGLTGLFISGLISSALSTMSAGLNTVAGTLYEDLVENFMPKQITERLASFVMKIIVILFGVVCVLMVYFVEKLGALVQMSYTLASCQNGAIFSAFALGLFFPWANSKGALWGIICSIAFNVWMITNAQLAKWNYDLVYPSKPTSIVGCHTALNPIHELYNITRLVEIAPGTFISKDLNSFFAVSFLYYTPMGAILGIIVGLLVSFLTGGNDLKTLSPNLISPPIRKFLPKNTNIKMEEYNLIEKNPSLEVTQHNNKSI